MVTSRRVLSRFALLGAGVLGVLGVGGVAIAHASSPATTYTGCVGRVTRVLRVVEEPSDCRRFEQVITIGSGEALVGPVGPEGPQGPAGNLALAGQQCPEGQFVTGFDAAGSLVCGEPLDPSSTGGDDGGTTTDADGDGYAPPADCDDANETVHPGAAEVLDGVDNDCDGSTDIVVAYSGIEQGVCTLTAFNALTGEVLTPGVDPVPEVPGDGLDNDCDGITDETA